MSHPLFIVGFQRSGTTLLRLMLDNHPDIAIPLDTVGLWARYEARLAEYDDLATADDCARLIRDLLAEERIRLWEVPLTVDEVLARMPGHRYPDVIEAMHRSYAAAKGKRIWGDKDPGNMLRIDSLNRWFPEGRVIHIIRDGRDACLSQLKQDFGFDDVLECACAWREQVWWVQRLGRVMGAARYRELRYEDLLENPERELRALCDFLGVSWSEQMLQYHTRVRDAVPDSKRHIWPLLDRPPQKDNAGRWRREMNAGDRVCFEKRAGALLKDLRYETLPGAPGGAPLAELRGLLRRAWTSVTRRFRG